MDFKVEKSLVDQVMDIATDIGCDCSRVSDNEIAFIKNGEVFRILFYMQDSGHLSVAISSRKRVKRLLYKWFEDSTSVLKRIVVDILRYCRV